MQEIHSASGTLPYPGLTAREVEAARLQYGPNVLAKPPRTPWYRQFAAKFRDPIIRILIVAALLSALTGGWLEGAGIALAILLATGIAFLNEYRAGKEFDILNEVDDDIPVKTIRDGAFIQVSRRDLVCGDVIFIETGEEVPADARVLAAVNCHVDQSKFTGEPEPVAKFPLDDTTAHESENDPYPADRLLRGSTVLDGYAYARIEAVGPATEIGRTAMAAAEETGNATPLQLQLERLSRVIAVIGGTLAALLFLILLTQAIYQGTLPHALSAYAAMEPIHILLGFFMIAVTLVVVAVPEGLAMSVTLSLAYSMRRMTADHNLVRKMHACETIGAATVICTDKTGTLTMNRMELREAHLPLLDGASPDAATPAGRLAADALAVNGTANLGDGENGPAVLGNPTEGALLLYLDRLGLDYRRLREEFTIQRQWTFHTERKFMATRGLPAGTATPVLHVKGAPEIVLERCGFLRDRDGIRPLTPEDRQRLLAEFQQTQRTGARTLAFAFREQPEETDDLDRAARELVGQARLLGDIDHRVLAEAVDAHVEPEAHYVRDFGPDGGIVVIQIRLALGEDVQVVFAQLLVILPGLAAEEAVPVVGLLARAVEAAARLAPEVVVVVRVVPVAAEPEPLVLSGGVVDHQIHDNAHTALMRALEHLLEYVHVPVLGVYRPVVGHVVAEVEVGRGIERREPYCVHAQALYIVQLGEDAPEVADAVAVAVAEAARPDLVYHRVLVPF